MFVSFITLLSFLRNIKGKLYHPHHLIHHYQHHYLSLQRLPLSLSLDRPYTKLNILQSRYPLHLPRQYYSGTRSSDTNFKNRNIGDKIKNKNKLYCKPTTTMIDNDNHNKIIEIINNTADNNNNSDNGNNLIPINNNNINKLCNNTNLKTTNNRKDGSHIVKCYVDDYDKQLDAKVMILRNLLSWPPQLPTFPSQEALEPEGSQQQQQQQQQSQFFTDHLKYYPIDIFKSPTSNYRMRANFQMWHDNPKHRTPEGFFYAMYDDDDKKEPCEIKNFPRGSKKINELMHDFLGIFHESSIIFQALFEVRFLTTQTNDAVVTLLYKKPLQNEWLAEAEKICKRLNIKIVGRSKKVMQVAGAESADDVGTVIEHLTIKDRVYKFYQTEGAFSQPNANVCEKMISWALDLSAPKTSSSSPSSLDAASTIIEKSGLVDINSSSSNSSSTSNSSSINSSNNDNITVEDSRITTPTATTPAILLEEDLLELYCGGGTFTIPLARNFRRVLATEISKASVELSHKSIKLNNISNIKIARLSSEEFYLAYHNKKKFQRLDENQININTYNITTVLVDPPRAGLDNDTCDMISIFDKIIYISCNPVTLARDVKKLLLTHDIIKVAAFDQFPYTHHLESGVYLIKKTSKYIDEYRDILNHHHHDNIDDNSHGNINCSGTNDTGGIQNDTYKADNQSGDYPDQNDDVQNDDIQNDDVQNDDIQNDDIQYDDAQNDDDDYHEVENCIVWMDDRELQPVEKKQKIE